MKTIQDFFIAKVDFTPRKRQRILKSDTDVTPSSFSTSAVVSSSPKTASSCSPFPPHSRRQRPKFVDQSTEPEHRKLQQQLYLDFGQASFGSRTLCPICNTLYVHGVKEDEVQHDRICKDYKFGVPFTLGKHTRVYEPFEDLFNNEILQHQKEPATVVEIRPTDSLRLRRKVKEVQRIVEKELGFSQSRNDLEDDDSPLEERTVFLYILNKRVIGFCSVEIISRAFQLRSRVYESDHEGRNRRQKKDDQTFQRSDQSFPATMGVYQLWCHTSHRQKGIATILLDKARSNFVYGTIVDAGQVAFSSPTGQGAAFAKKYCGTSEPLIYDC